MWNVQILSSKHENNLYIDIDEHYLDWSNLGYLIYTSLFRNIVLKCEHQIWYISLLMNIYLYIFQSSMYCIDYMRFPHN